MNKNLTFIQKKKKKTTSLEVSLMTEKRALTKFLRCVEWSDVQVSVLLLLVHIFHGSYFSMSAGSKASNSTHVQMGNDRCM